MIWNLHSENSFLSKTGKRDSVPVSDRRQVQLFADAAIWNLILTWSTLRVILNWLNHAHNSIRCKSEVESKMIFHFSTFLGIGENSGDFFLLEGWFALCSNDKSMWIIFLEGYCCLLGYFQMFPRRPLPCNSSRPFYSSISQSAADEKAREKLGSAAN